MHQDIYLFSLVESYFITVKAWDMKSDRFALDLNQLPLTFYLTQKQITWLPTHNYTRPRYESEAI